MAWQKTAGTALTMRDVKDKDEKDSYAIGEHGSTALTMRDVKVESQEKVVETVMVLP